MKLILLISLAVAFASATVFFEENFGDGWEANWVKSTAKGDEAADLVSDAGGAKTSVDARFYQYSREFPEFSNEGKDLVFQFSVAHPQGIDCGGGYWKLLPKGFDPKTFDGETEYNIMFGPDICGGTKRTHAIINYAGKNNLITKDLPTQSDKFTHVFTLILKPNRQFQVLIDNNVEREGDIADEWDVLEPKEIEDPSESKPEDWVDDARIPDPEDVKPAGWDDIPEEIVDPDATKPDDWDDDLDGEWQAPTIHNPEYKGEWQPKMIDNPDYKGPWVHPKIANPDFVDDKSVGQFKSIAGIGLEIWQVKAGTIFDNILVTDDIDAAKAAAEKILEVQAEEKAAAEAAAEEARKAAEAEAAKAKAEEEAKKGEEEEETKDEL